MHTKVLILLGLACLCIMVLIRRRDFFASQDLSNTIPFTDTTTAVFAMLSQMELLLNELSKNQVYPSANALVSAMGSSYPMYSSDTEIEELFAKAYTDGEATLSERDRLLLREIVFYNSLVWEAIGRPITYTSDGSGVPDFASTTISESNKSVREFLFSVIKNDYNNILPSRFSRIADQDNYKMDTDTDQQRVLWIIRAMTIPVAYIKWLSENKWKLDMTWKPATCPASVTRTPTRITTVPGNLSFGPGTYTMSQLGNPTSLSLTAPIKVVVYTSGGSSTRNIENSFGCRGVDGAIDQLSGATSIVVS